MKALKAPVKDLYDAEAERSVIGAALNNYVVGLAPEDFFLHQNRRIWQVIQRLGAAGEPLDIMTVGAALGDDTKYSYLTQCLQAGSSLTADFFARRIADLAGRRAAEFVGTEMIRELHNEELELEQTVGRAIGELSLAGGRIKRTQRLDTDDLVESYLDAKVLKAETWGMKSGIGAVDVELGGIHQGETFCIAGEPGVGKSIFCQQVGLQLAGLSFWRPQNLDSEPNPGAVFQLEMSTEQTVERAACGLSNVEMKKMKQGRLDEDEEYLYMRALERIRDAPIHWSDDTHWNSVSLSVEVARLARDHAIRWVLIDYAGKLRDEAENETQRERIISQSLTNMAKDNDVAVIFVETLSKQGFKKTEAGKRRRGMEAITGSVLKMYNASVAAFIELPVNAGEKSDERRLRFTKVREGDPFMMIPFLMDGPKKRFQPIQR